MLGVKQVRSPAGGAKTVQDRVEVPIGQKRPPDPKLIVDISVGEVEEAPPSDDGKNKAAQELDRMGGKARRKG